MSQKMAKTPSAGQKVTKSARAKAVRKWVMAVDPFSDLDFRSVVEFTKGVAGQAGAEVYGTYVLAPELLNFTGEFSGAWLKRYKPVAEAKAKESGKALGVEIEVVPSRKAGLQHSVNTLVKYSDKIRAECIVVSTHARHGLERWVLGSFAESVLLTSKIPVLAVHPSQKLPANVKKIFVPTDLSPQSLKFILKAAEFAQRVGASLDVFYRQPDPLDPMIQQGVYAMGGGWVSVQTYLDDSAKEAEKQLGKIGEGLRKRGIKTETLMTTARGSASLVDAIEDAAKARGADMIAVLTQSGSVAATVLGSVARGLVRTSPIPVMIFR